MSSVENVLVNAGAGQNQPQSLQDLHAENARLAGELAEARARIKTLEHLADSDPLTGLPNRRALVRELGRAIARVQRYDRPAALFYVDLDNLKRLNDAHGHAAGDAALGHIAGLLARGLRSGDMVARLGGDEFAVLIESVDAEAARAKAAALARETSATPFRWNGHALPIGISIGATAIAADDTVEILIARADAAMYDGKSDQRSER